MPEISTLLVANRGEIARRIFRTCRRMGIRTVAIYSEADANAPHVLDADIAVPVGPTPAAESYLNIDNILAAARLSGADAIHPGYGFLAENAEFARACRAAGLIFVGPSAELIDEMGSKAKASAHARAAGLQTIPGYRGAETSDLRRALTDEGVTLPVLLKASAGGGGRGMRLVDSWEDLPQAVEAAKREALSAFGDDQLLIEQYLPNARHIEVQILGDEHGNVIHLWERDCSLQRRHQKVIEESPAPNLPGALRQEICESALSFARSIGYTSAGTVELLLAPDNRYFFLEVNTRLQVEHPVTELVCGVDIVEEQIRIAEGKTLSILAPPEQRGSAIECRIYAEDPARGWLPQTGTLRSWSLDSELGLRIDSGVEQGSAVTPDYDPMLAKLIAYGSDRATAIRRARRGLEAMTIHGVQTNRDALINILASETFSAGQANTATLSDQPELRLAREPSPAALSSILAAAIFAASSSSSRAANTAGVRSGFRNLGATNEQDSFHLGERALSCTWSWDRRGDLLLQIDDEPSERFNGRLIEPEIWFISSTTLGMKVGVRIIDDEVDSWTIEGSWTLHRCPRLPAAATQQDPGSCLSPMPGKIVQLLVSVGDYVERGQPLLRMEAMKMEHTINAPHSGMVAQLLCQEGDQVDDGETLIIVSAEEPQQ